MSGRSQVSMVAEGKDALERGGWAEALDCFSAALGVSESADAHAGLAQAAWWLGDEARLFHARERAYQLYVEQGDSLGAARMATWLFTDSIEFRGEIAVANGWRSTAERSLEGVLAGSTEAGWLALWGGAVALAVHNDPAAALEDAERASAVAASGGESDLAALANALRGFAKVRLGEVADGLALMDQAGVAAINGEIHDLVARSTAMCWVIGACDHARDYHRAGQWCERFEAVERAWCVDGMFSICRPHYAVVLIQQGRWDEAARELEEGIHVLGRFRPPMAKESIVRLADLHWKQGRSREAMDLYGSAETDKLSLLGRSEAALDDGDAAEALALADRYLRQVPEESVLERIPGLELVVAASVSIGSGSRANEGLAQLEAPARKVGTGPATAAALVARGRIELSRHAYASAQVALEDAVDAHIRNYAMFDASRARVLLAVALKALGRDRRAAEELDAAEEWFRSVQAQRELSRTATIRSGGDAAVPDDGTSTLTKREKGVLRLLAEGNSNEEIADALVLSLRTVERHVSNVYGKLGLSGRAARAAAAALAHRSGWI